MSSLAGRIAIVTGAGRGLGRAHALFLSEQGASVVVNDIGGSLTGEGSSVTPAQRVVNEIRERGGQAIASYHDVADWTQAREMIELAVDTFGDLHVLVNNAGIVRDRTLVKMSEEEWDLVIRVLVKGHAAPTRHAVAYWYRQHKAGREVKASIIHTTSAAGFAGNFGQANYSAAKAAVLAFSQVVRLEASRYGVRSNAVSPSARTRLTLSIPGSEERLAVPTGDEFDFYDPANVSPLIGWLSEADCPANGQIFQISGNRLLVLSMPPIVHRLETTGRWTLEALRREVPSHLVEAPGIDAYIKA